jgi:S-formylglutathione hydrolase FrmB
MSRPRARLAALACLLIAETAACAAVAPAPAAPARPPAPASAPEKCAWTKFTVRSPSSGKVERFWVGHARDLDASAKHPVIYFLGGLLDSDDTWKNALDQHLARTDIIAVCPAVGGGVWFMNSPAQPWMRWGDYLRGDLRAFVEARYPASPHKGQRAVAGISAGAHGAFYQAMTHPDMYGSVSVISGAMDLRGYAGQFGLQVWVGPDSPETRPLYAERSCIALAEKAAGPLPFDLFMDVGDKDGALPQMMALRRLLEARGQTPRWYIGRGAHNWDYWNARAAEHLAWHAEQFQRNRREGRLTETPAEDAPPLEVLKAPPQVNLSAEALARLRAPWTEAALAPLPVKGVRPVGIPLGGVVPGNRQAAVTATLPDAGVGPGLGVYRLTITVTVAEPGGGVLSLGGAINNGMGLRALPLVPVMMTIPDGTPGRTVTLRARLAMERIAPDVLRGGMAAGLAAFDAAGKPAGDVAVGRARPGTLLVERWPIAPQALLELVVSADAARPLPNAALTDVRIEAEPAAP